VESFTLIGIQAFFCPFWEKDPSHIGKCCVVNFVNLGRNLIALKSNFESFHSLKKEFFLWCRWDNCGSRRFRKKLFDNCFRSLWIFVF